jgi:hypothetical protein
MKINKGLILKAVSKKKPSIEILKYIKAYKPAKIQFNTNAEDKGIIKAWRGLNTLQKRSLVSGKLFGMAFKTAVKKAAARSSALETASSEAASEAAKATAKTAATSDWGIGELVHHIPSN